MFYPLAIILLYFIRCWVVSPSFRILIEYSAIRYNIAVSSQVLGCVSILLRAQHVGLWYKDDTLKTLLKNILVFTLHSQPKVSFLFLFSFKCPSLRGDPLGTILKYIFEYIYDLNFYFVNFSLFIVFIKTYSFCIDNLLDPLMLDVNTLSIFGVIQNSFLKCLEYCLLLLLFPFS